MKQSHHCDQVIDVTGELIKFTWLLRGRADSLLDRYSERKEPAQKLLGGSISAASDQRSTHSVRLRDA